jgi:hypothetical protein
MRELQGAYFHVSRSLCLSHDMIWLPHDVLASISKVWVRVHRGKVVGIIGGT